MIELPPEIIWVIAENLNFRSLCRLRLACKNYSDLLHNLVDSRKRELFDKYTLIDKDNSVIFKPGPAITTLPKNFPIDGIYFFEIVEYDRNSCLSLGMINEDIDYCLHGEINFFFQDFNRMLRNCYDTKCMTQNA